MEKTKGKSISIWQCDECKDKNGKPVTQKANYADISVVGFPICPECGVDMIFVSEKWVIGGKK